MKKRSTRLLLAMAALIQLAGAIIHAAAFPVAAQLLDGSGLRPAMASASKALWLADSSNLVAFGLIFGWLAWRGSASTALLGLLALAPLFSAALLYHFMGSFFAAHLMMASALLVLAAAWIEGPRTSAVG